MSYGKNPRIGGKYIMDYIFMVVHICASKLKVLGTGHMDIYFHNLVGLIIHIHVCYTLTILYTH